VPDLEAAGLPAQSARHRPRSYLSRRTPSV